MRKTKQVEIIYTRKRDHLWLSFVLCDLEKDFHIEALFPDIEIGFPSLKDQSISPFLCLPISKYARLRFCHFP